MSKKIIKRLKLFAWGFLTAIVVMVMANRYSGCFIKRRGENLKDIFSKPAPTETLSDTRMANYIHLNIEVVPLLLKAIMLLVLMKVVSQFVKKAKKGSYS